MHMKDYTLTVRQVLESLATLADSYETVSRGGSPTGNYFFAVNVADMAASLKAAQVLISQLPYWIPVEERLPEIGVSVLCSSKEPPGEDCVWIGQREEYDWYFPGANEMGTPTHWMPLPEPPEVK